MELIIVLTILAVMSAAAIPVFSGSLGTVESDHAVRDFVALIKYAQERAVTDLREYRLYLDPEKGRYFLMTLQRTAEGKKRFKALDEKQGEALFLPSRLTMKKPSAKKDRKLGLYYVSFYPSGACDEATITLQSKDSGKIKIETGGSLGKIKVDRDKH